MHSQRRVTRLSQQNCSRKKKIADENSKRKSNGKLKNDDSKNDSKTDDSKNDSKNEDSKNDERPTKLKKEDEIIRFMIISHRNDKAIQRADIVRNCFPKDQEAVFDGEILERVKGRLRRFFGFEILETPERPGFFYLSNVLHVSEYLLSNDNQQRAIDGLLYVILSNIFMREPKEKFIADTIFYAFLSRLGVELMQKHTIFGDVRTLIRKTFVEQGWLEIRNETNENVDGNEPLETYGWGWRALALCSRNDMIDMVGRVMFKNVTDPSRTNVFRAHNSVRCAAWTKHYAVAEKEDRIIGVTVEKDEDEDGEEKEMDRDGEVQEMDHDGEESEDTE